MSEKQESNADFSNQGVIWMRATSLQLIQRDLLSTHLNHWTAAHIRDDSWVAMCCIMMQRPKEKNEKNVFHIGAISNHPISFTTFS